MSRWLWRTAAIKSIIAEASLAEKQEIRADADLMARLDSKLRHDDMLTVFNNLNVPLVDKLNMMLGWTGYAQEVVSLIEKADEAEKEEITNHTVILSDIMTRFRSDIKQQVVRHLNLQVAQMFTNFPNDGKVGLTSLMVLSQDLLTISKDVNFVAADSFVHDQSGFEALKNRLIAAVTNYLSGKFKLKISSTHDEQGHEADREYPIMVKLVHNPSANYLLFLHGGVHGEGYVKKLQGHIYELGQKEGNENIVPSVYLAHEGAHLILGANDEYAGVWPPVTDVYQDHSLMGNFYREGLEQAEIKKRHYQFLVPLLAPWFPDRIISII